MTRLTPHPQSYYPPRHARASYVRPYVLAHERRMREREAAERARREERRRASAVALAGAGSGVLI
ncbi:hypothetical protein [Streptomonospora arabica]|uniref:Uncharacterized protein n=1 Tax=Streptomonospora arabica TaxID=412417 RepID=A0ABV9SPW9_9ACTN